MSGPTSSTKKPVSASKPSSDFPSFLSSSGLWSHVSTWLGPPFMKSQITAFARGGRGGAFGARGARRVGRAGAGGGGGGPRRANPPAPAQHRARDPAEARAGALQERAAAA